MVLDNEEHRDFLLSKVKNATINGLHIEKAYELLQAIKNAEIKEEKQHD